MRIRPSFAALFPALLLACPVPPSAAGISGPCPFLDRENPDPSKHRYDFGIHALLRGRETAFSGR
jgi:hypothetical protein